MVISSLPGDEAALHLSTICAAQAQSLTLAIDEAGKSEEGGSSRTRGRNPEPVKWLDRLSAILRQLAPAPPASFSAAPTLKPPWSPTVHQTWPVLSRCLAAFAQSQRTVEHCCKTIRFAVRSLGIDSFDFLPALVQQMVEIYDEYPHSCILYLGSILVDEYGSFPDIGPGLLAMLQALTNKTFLLLNNEHGFRDHPDTIDDLFRLCIRFVQRAPCPFFECKAAPVILQTAVKGLRLDHYEAHTSVAKFLNQACEFALHMRKSGEKRGWEAEEVLRAVGPALVSSALQGAAFSLSRSQIRNIPDVLFSLRRLEEERMSEWLRAALSDEESFGGFGVTPLQMAAFHSAVLHAKDAKAIIPPLKEFIQLFR